MRLSPDLFDVRTAEIMVAHVDRLRRLPRAPGAFTVRPVARHESAALEAFSGDSLKAGRLLSSGDVGLVAVADDRIHAMEWVRFGPCEYEWDARHLGVVFKVPPRFCWLHNGSGAALGSWAVVMGRLPTLLDEHGIEIACLQVSAGNTYSLRCHESLGFTRAGRVTAARVAGRSMVWLRTSRLNDLRFHTVSVDLGRIVH